MAVVGGPSRSSEPGRPPCPKKAAAASKRAAAAASGKRAALRFGDAEGAVAAPARGGGPQTAGSRQSRCSCRQAGERRRCRRDVRPARRRLGPRRVLHRAPRAAPRSPSLRFSDLELLTTSAARLPRPGVRRLPPRLPRPQQQQRYQRRRRRRLPRGHAPRHHSALRRHADLDCQRRGDSAAARGGPARVHGALAAHGPRGAAAALRRGGGRAGLKTPITARSATSSWLRPARAPYHAAARQRPAPPPLPPPTLPPRAQPSPATWQRICMDAASLHPDCTTLSYQALGRQEDVWREVSLLLYAETPRHRRATPGSCS